MSSVINSLLFTISTFTKFPLPYHNFDLKKAPYTYFMLPIVGLLLGCFNYLIIKIGLSFNIESSILSIILIISLILSTGGIHFDGLLDTLDAIKSYRNKEDKLRIIKDSRIGAFALIYYTVYLSLYYIGFYYLINSKQIILIIFITIIARLNLIILIKIKKHQPDDMMSLLLSREFLKKAYLVY
ncbi:MAG: adenosylcobinamide-GDP ribazoletransferase, partial [Bacilli bacterium]